MMSNSQTTLVTKSRHVSSKNESPRLFENEFMEFFSKVHPATPMVLFLPVVTCLIYFVLARRGLSIAATAGLFAFGLLLWTLIEYLMHRHLFHYEPKSRFGKRVHFLVHGAHHDYPQDASRLVAPPAFSIPVGLVFYGIFLVVFGRLAPAAFAGFLFGYVCYDTLHYAQHHLLMKRGLGLWLKRHHMHHHYKDHEHGFGVSSPLWDYVFRTRAPRPAESANSLDDSADFVGTANH